MATRMAAARLDQASTALFICDIQERFVNAIYGFSHMVNSSAKVIKGSSILNIPVFTTEQNPKALGSTVAELKQNFPSSTPIHPKTRFSMVLPSGETDEFLQSKNIKNIMIVGIESHVCVLQTSLDLLGRGYGVWILRDCVSSCNKEEVPIAIERMQLAGATVSTSESVLFELMVDSKHSNFKQISSLVKEEKDRTKASLEGLAPLSKY